MDATDALQFLDFVDQSPSPFHAVATVVSQLEESGFTRLREKVQSDCSAWPQLWMDAILERLTRCPRANFCTHLQTAWKLKPGKKYFLTRNQSTVVGHVLQKQQKQ